jgi:endonuclease YncB( thermonuclease family)
MQAVIMPDIPGRHKCESSPKCHGKFAVDRDRKVGMKPLLAMVFSILASIALPAHAAPWKTLQNCRLIDHEYHDGDSFWVECEGRKYILRLYFVDAPETGDDIKGRVEEQAKYFGITNSQVLKAGAEANKRTQQWLAAGFTAFTRFEDAGGQSERKRYFAFIRLSDGRDLGEALVRAGLARVYGKSVISPEGESIDAIFGRLRGLEKEAKSARRGAWGKEMAGRRGSGPLSLVSIRARVVDENPVAGLGIGIVVERFLSEEADGMVGGGG